MTLGNDLSKFAIFGGEYISFGPDRSTITLGSVGVSPGTTISGNYQLRDGTAESNTLASKAAAIELASAYNSGSTISCQHSLSTGDLSGLSPRAGVYCSEGDVFSLSDMSTLVLDAHNVSGATWIFQTVGNLTSGLASKVILKNGASASNVYWVVGGNTNIGAGSSMAGNILSPLTIRIGASGNLDGRALSESSVIFEGHSSAVLPLLFFRSSSPTSFPSGSPSFAPSLKPFSKPTRAPFVLSKMASLCIISAIPTRYNQSTWSGTDASEAMMQAIAFSMGVPVSTVQCGYAEQLCRLSPTRAPSAAPTSSSRNKLGQGLLSSHSLSINAPRERGAMETTGVLPASRLLSFSITKIIPGRQNFH